MHSENLCFNMIVVLESNPQTFNTDKTTITKMKVNNRTFERENPYRLLKY